MKININLLIFSISLLQLSCSDFNKMAPLLECESNEELNVICEFTNPEDIVVTPDNNFLIVSEYGGQKPIQKEKSGQLAALDINLKKRSDIEIMYAENIWGEPTCKRNANQLHGPHGIDLVERTDGKYMLGVVSHLPTERVDMYELAKNVKWYLIWRGCVETEGKYYLNDVSLMPDGSFYTTHMFEEDFPLYKWILANYLKFDTGFVVKWSPKNGFLELKQTAGSYPNGIAVDVQRNTMVVNYNLGDEIVLYDLKSSDRLASINGNSPDNIVLTDNHFWAVIHDYKLTDYSSCGSNVNCSLPWSVLKLNRDNLNLIERIPFESVNMGIGTVALKVDDTLWFGSFRSNRLGFIEY